jgi:hypothetical protein
VSVWLDGEDNIVELVGLDYERDLPVGHDYILIFSQMNRLGILNLDKIL